MAEEITLDQFQDRLSVLMKQVETPQELLGDIGEVLLNNTRDRLSQGIDINGQPFKPLAALTLAVKSRNTDKILIESGDMFRELSWQLVNGGRSLEFGSDRKYAALHQFGGVIKPKKAKSLAFKGKFLKQAEIPARPWLGITPFDQQQILEVVQDHVEQSFD